MEHCKVVSNDDFCCAKQKLLLKSKTKHFSEGSIIADSHELAQGLMVITSGYVNVELPIDSEEADEENRDADGRTVLYVFGRGYAFHFDCCLHSFSSVSKNVLVKDDARILVLDAKQIYERESLQFSLVMMVCLQGFLGWKHGYWRLEVDWYIWGKR
jgi:hypothetical protein